MSFGRTLWLVGEFPSVFPKLFETYNTADIIQSTGVDGFFLNDT